MNGNESVFLILGLFLAVAAFEEEFDIDMDEDAAWAVQTVSEAVKFTEDMLK